MDSLPHILVISDVNVELTSAGSTLLYRLLEAYPKDRLFIVQSKPFLDNRILEGVKYKQISGKNAFVKRLSNSRFYPVASFIEYLKAHRLNAEVERVVDEFNPDVIVSVTFRFAWILGWKVAKKYNLPLHLILHDDIITAEKHGIFLKPFLKNRFKKIYRFASSRFCISHNMEKMYRTAFGAAGQVIYPTLGKDDVAFQIPARIKVAGKSLRFCYAGSLYTPDFPEMLNQLANVLQERGHTLTVFSEAKKEDLKNFAYLQADHVQIREFVHPAILRDFMIEQVDVNVLLNSFQLEKPFRWNFSSKLVEYTIVALPALLWGPQSSGAIDWAIKNNYEGVLNENCADKLNQVIDKFEDTEKRFLLASHLQQIGLETFGYEENYAVFVNNIVELQSVQTKTFEYNDAKYHI
jgi:hypothetical protein